MFLVSIILGKNATLAEDLYGVQVASINLGELLGKVPDAPSGRIKIHNCK